MNQIDLAPHVTSRIFFSMKHLHLLRAQYRRAGVPLKYCSASPLTRVRAATALADDYAMILCAAGVDLSPKSVGVAPHRHGISAPCSASRAAASWSPSIARCMSVIIHTSALRKNFTIYPALTQRHFSDNLRFTGAHLAVCVYRHNNIFA